MANNYSIRADQVAKMQKANTQFVPKSYIGEETTEET